MTEAELSSGNRVWPTNHKIFASGPLQEKKAGGRAADLCSSVYIFCGITQLHECKHLHGGLG